MATIIVSDADGGLSCLQGHRVRGSRGYGQSKALPVVLILTIIHDGDGHTLFSVTLSDCQSTTGAGEVTWSYKGIGTLMRYTTTIIKVLDNLIRNFKHIASLESEHTF